MDGTRIILEKSNVAEMGCFAAYFVWLLGSFISIGVPGALPEMSHVFVYISLMAMALAFVVVMLVLRKRTSPVNRFASLPAACVMSVACYAILLIDVESHWDIVLACGVIIGFASACFVVACLAILLRPPVRLVAPILAVSQIIALIVFMLLAYVPQPVFSIISYAMPVVSALFASLSISYAEASPINQTSFADGETSYAIPFEPDGLAQNTMKLDARINMRIFVSCIVIGFALGISRGAMRPAAAGFSDTAYMAFYFGIVGLLVAFLMFYFSRGKFDNHRANLSTPYRFFLYSFTFCLILFAFVPSGELVSYACLLFALDFVWVILVYLSHAQGGSLSVIAKGQTCFSSIGDLAGSTVSIMMLLSPHESGFRAYGLLFSVVLIVLVMTLILPEDYLYANLAGRRRKAIKRNGESSRSHSGEQEENARKSGDAPGVSDRHGNVQSGSLVNPDAVNGGGGPFAITLEDICADIAAKYNLTKRESEVFTLLARGYSTAGIAGSLVLAESTVAVHIKHIYEKTDVRTRQGIIDMVEECAREYTTASSRR